MLERSIPVVAVAALLGISNANAREEPLWEAGIGVAGLHFPDYRGSDHSRNYALPVPYFVYRGEVLKADRQGVRGLFFAGERVAVNLSVGASLPVSSRENSARQGMPDLKPSVEAGPSIEISLWKSPDRRTAVELRLPVRGAVTIEASPRYVGTQFYPHLNFNVHGPGGLAGWNLGLLAGPVFTDSRYNRHFYSVPAEFASASRPAYHAGGGYAGTELIAALSKRFPRFWVGGFVRYDTLRGAVFEESPLVRTKRYVAAGFGISWILAESAKRVTVNEFGEALR